MLTIINKVSYMQHICHDCIYDHHHNPNQYRKRDITVTIQDHLNDATALLINTILCSIAVTSEARLSSFLYSPVILSIRSWKVSFVICPVVTFSSCS